MRFVLKELKKKSNRHLDADHTESVKDRTTNRKTEGHNRLRNYKHKPMFSCPCLTQLTWDKGAYAMSDIGTQGHKLCQTQEHTDIIMYIFMWDTDFMALLISHDF